MMRRMVLALVAGGMLGLGLWSGGAVRAEPVPNTQLQRFYYYPYYYFPHNYWPIQGPRYPEPIGAPYMRPPAYMSYPAFHEPSWRYDLWQPARYYRGFHFWLDQF